MDKSILFLTHGLEWRLNGGATLIPFPYRISPSRHVPSFPMTFLCLLSFFIANPLFLSISSPLFSTIQSSHGVSEALWAPHGTVAEIEFDASSLYILAIRLMTAVSVTFMRWSSAKCRLEPRFWPTQNLLGVEWCWSITRYCQCPVVETAVALEWT